MFAPTDRQDPRDASVVRVANIARDLAHLPGAATPDWCRLAAAILTRHDPTTRAWFAVLAGEDRRAESLGESVGGAVRAPVPRLGAPLTRLAGGAAGTVELPGVFPLGALLDRLDGLPRGTGILRQHGRILVGLAEAGLRGVGGAPGRVLAVFWERPDGGASAPEDMQLVLTSVLLVARDRLEQALGDGPNPWLSACEQRVLDLLTDGLSVPEVAAALGRSPHTVHDHVKRLHAKLGTRTRGALLARVLGTRPPRRSPSRPGRAIVPFRSGLFVDHGAR